jgi:COP9 signalosome complex subunit 7
VSLGLENSRELEEVVISAIYAGLVQATLDPYHQLVAVSSVSPLRDLQLNSIPAMLTTLSEWSERCSGSLSDLEKQIAAVKSEALRRAREEQEWNKEVEKLVDGGKGEKKEEGGGLFANLGNLGKKLGGGRRADDEFEEMDVDEEGGKGKKRSFGLLASGK